MNENQNQARTIRLKVSCTREEKTQIEANARAAGMSVSRYLRNVGMGYKIEGVIDATRLIITRHAHITNNDAEIAS